MEKRSLVFENKVSRKIRGAVYDVELGCWRRRTNTEIGEITQRITNYIMTQRSQWFEYGTRRDESVSVKE